MKSENYVIIQGWMCNELQLKGNDLLVFALIYGFSQDGVSMFSGGRQYIADTFNISKPTVDKALQNLISMDYIIKYPSADFVHTDSYATNIGVVKKLYEGSKETLPGGSKETLLNKDSKHSNKKIDKSNSKELLQIPEELKSEELKNENKKKPNLYSKCMYSIETYTQDEDLRLYLKTMLDLRLEIAKDEGKPFYFSMWAHLLKELTDLGGKSDVELAKQIVLNSTSHGWKHFYAITDNNYVRNTRKKDVFGEQSKVKSNGYTDEDEAEDERINKEREKKGMRTRF